MVFLLPAAVLVVGSLWLIANASLHQTNAKDVK